MYTRDEMLAIYKEGGFRNMDFADKFAHAQNATTPEILIPLANVPMSSEEAELRKNSTLGPMQQPGRQDTREGGKGGRGFQDRGDREGGRGKGKGGRDDPREGRDGKGRGARADGDWSRGERYSGPEERGRGRDGRQPREGDRYLSGGRDDRRAPRDSAGSDDGGGHPAVPAAPPLPHLPAPPPPKDWFYRDLEHNVQGPFTEAQISEWHTAGYLPADLQMRAADESDQMYVSLSDLMNRDPEGEPPFLKLHRERQMYEAERERLKKDWEALKAQEDERKRVAEERRAARAAAAAAEEERMAREPPPAGLPPPPAKAAAMRQEEETRKRQEHAQLMAAQEAQRQQEAEMHRKMIEDARRQAEEEARNAAAEVRRQALDEARRQAEAEVRQQAEMMQAQMKAQAEQLVRQQQEQAAQAQRQAEVLQHVTKWPSWRGHSWPPRAPRAASEGSGLAF